MAGVKDRPAQTRTSAEGNVCPCLSMNVLEVHAAASVTIQSNEGTPGIEQRLGGIGWGGGSFPFAGCKDDSRVHFCIYRLKSCYCNIQKKIITTELQSNDSSALVKLIGNLNACET